MNLYECIFASITAIAIVVFLCVLIGESFEFNSYEAYIEGVKFARESPMSIAEWRESPKASAIQ